MTDPDMNQIECPYCLRSHPFVWPGFEEFMIHCACGHSFICCQYTEEIKKTFIEDVERTESKVVEIKYYALKRDPETGLPIRPLDEEAQAKEES